MPNDNHDKRDQGQDEVSEEPNLESISRRLEEARQQMAELEHQLKLARGTRRLDPDRFPKTLDQLIQEVLQRRLATLDEIAKEVNAPLLKVSEAMEGLKKQGKIHNVGSEDRQMWTWRPGDVVPASELEAYVRRLISWAPMTLIELIAATGARNSRVSGAVVAIQRSGEPPVDLGSGGRARWFLMTKYRDARLDPKLPKPKR
jgi:hypothetical protein